MTLPAADTLSVKFPAGRVQTLGEEVANSVSHGVAVLAALVAYPFLVIVVGQRGGALDVIAVSIFACTMILLYLASTLFHALPHGGAKRVFQVLDHAAIYLLIAGTYTPFTLGILRGTIGWTMFGVIWTLALAGCVLKATRGLGSANLSTGLYLAMGWLIVLAAGKIWDLMPAWGIFWLLSGGLLYSIGAAFFSLSERLRYGHFVWHLFVIAGSVCHFIAVLFYSS